MTCPAYQSRFILDDKYREAHFALFDEDSLPKSPQFESRRTWYGTVEKKGFLRRKREMETIEMVKVYAPLEEVDTATFDASDFVPTGDSTVRVAQVDSVPIETDPVAIDSNPQDSTGETTGEEAEYAIVSVATPDDHTYNMDQSLYMYYVGEEIQNHRQAAYNAWKREEALRIEEQRVKDSTRAARKAKFLSFFDFLKPKDKSEEETQEEEYDPFLDYGEDEPSTTDEQTATEPEKEGGEEESSESEEEDPDNGNGL